MPHQLPHPRHDLAWWREAVRLRRHILSLKAQTRLLRHDLAAKSYNPNQPRVPAGSSTGGQWTRGAAGGGSGAPGIDLSGLFGDLVSGLGAAFAPSPVVADVGGSESWASYQESTRADGSLAERAVVNRDGSTIHSEYAAPGTAGGWDERHTVTLPDGGKTTFETRDRTQTIRAGGPDGEIVSRATWTERGPEPEATVQLARGPLRRGAEEAVNAAGAVLFGWLSARDDIDGQRTVMGFLPRDYRPGSQGQQAPLTFVGKLPQEEVKKACDLLGKVQELANQAAEAAGDRRNFSSAATYGTNVHVRFRDFVNDLNDMNFRAERSFAKEAADPTSQDEINQGYSRSVRVDAYELTKDGTLCIYDLKTGRRGLSNSRADILAAAARLGLTGVQRVIVIEVRPRN